MSENLAYRLVVAVTYLCLFVSFLGDWLTLLVVPGLVGALVQGARIDGLSRRAQRVFGDEERSKSASGEARSGHAPG